MWNEKSKVSNIHKISCILSIYDEKTLAQFNTYLIGYYILPLGRMTLYTSTINNKVLMKYNETSSIILLFIIVDNDNITIKYIDLFDSEHSNQAISSCFSQVTIDVKDYNKESLNVLYINIYIVNWLYS